MTQLRDNDFRPAFISTGTKHDNNNNETPGLIQDWEMYPPTHKFKKKIRKIICTMACRKYRGKR